MAIQTAFCANPSCPCHNIKVGTGYMDKKSVSLYIGGMMYDYTRTSIPIKSKGDKKILWVCNVCVAAWYMLRKYKE